MRVSSFCALLFALSACDPSQPNHIGSPVLLPLEAVKSGASNLVYGTKRAKVSRFVHANFNQLQVEMLSQGGPTEKQAMDLAGIPQSERFRLHKEVQSNPELYFSGDPEPLIVALMVHGN